MVNTFTGNARSWHGTWRIADTVGWGIRTLLRSCGAMEGKRGTWHRGGHVLWNFRGLWLTGWAGWHGTWRIADTVGCAKGRKGHKGQEGQSVFGVVWAMYIGISADYGSLAAFFFCTLCFCVIPGRLPTLYPVPLSFSSFLSFLSFTLLPPCALHPSSRRYAVASNVLCQP